MIGTARSHPVVPNGVECEEHEGRGAHKGVVAVGTWVSDSGIRSIQLQLRVTWLPCPVSGNLLY
jgi:hypothetical protein